MDIKYQMLHGHELRPYLEELANLRITVFREFPYLYDGSLDYEKEYLETYIKNPSSLVILAQVDNKVIGASTCVPMKDETEEFTKVFEEEFPIEKIMYFGESIILKEYRGNKIGHEFFRLREEYASKTIQDLAYTCFCAVDRPKDHPLTPDNYRPLDQFWGRMGYYKHETLKVHFPWKDIDKFEEDKKAMSVWLKKWK